MIPQISGAADTQMETARQPSLTYRVTENQISGNIDGIEAVRQTVYHILHTERYAYAIYGDNYGAELERYKGRSFAYLRATIENTLSDALIQDDRISGVKDVTATKSGIDSALVEFTVICELGDIGMEVMIDV